MQNPIDSTEYQSKVPKAYRIPRYRVGLVREGVESCPANRYSNSRDVWSWAHRLLFDDIPNEAFYCIALDNKNKLIGLTMVSLGSLNTSVVHPRSVLQPLILSNAAATILLHNHPSGDPAPSREDREVTERLVKACGLLGIRVLDHIVCCESDYYSFADAGVMGAGIMGA